MTPHKMEPVEMTVPPTKPKVPRMMAIQSSTVSMAGLAGVRSLKPSLICDCRQCISSLLGVVRTLNPPYEFCGAVVVAIG